MMIIIIEDPVIWYEICFLVYSRLFGASYFSYHSLFLRGHGNSSSSPSLLFSLSVGHLFRSHNSSLFSFRTVERRRDGETGALLATAEWGLRESTRVITALKHQLWSPSYLFNSTRAPLPRYLRSNWWIHPAHMCILHCPQSHLRPVLTARSPLPPVSL